MESRSPMYYLQDFMGDWEGVRFEDAAYGIVVKDLVVEETPSSPESVEQDSPSCDLVDLEDLSSTEKKFTPLLTYTPSFEEEFFFESLDDNNFMGFLVHRGPGTMGFASGPNESDFSPRKKNVPDFQPTNNQATCAAHLPTSVSDHAATRRTPEDTEDKPYIKKPPNAFMLFRAEQRQNVVDELHITDSAKVNTVLGQRWKMMSEKEQAPYFEKAHREKRAHEAKYPGWSFKDNFGKRAKKKKADKIPAPPNHHHFTSPANLQAVKMLPYAAAPMTNRA